MAAYQRRVEHQHEGNPAEPHHQIDQLVRNADDTLGVVARVDVFLDPVENRQPHHQEAEAHRFGIDPRAHARQQGRQQHDADAKRRQRQAPAVMLGEERSKRLLRRNHLRGRPSEHPRPEQDDRWEALHPMQDHGAAQHDDRNAHQQADHHQQEAAVCGTGHGKHVVHAHHRIGDHDGGQRPAQRGRGGMGRPLCAPTRRHGQLPGDPDQRQAADQQETRDAQQPHHRHRQHRPHHHGADRAPENGFLLQMGGQAARREADDDGVVTGEHQVDQDDGQQGREEFGRENFHIGRTPMRSKNAGSEAHLGNGTSTDGQGLARASCEAPARPERMPVMTTCAAAAPFDRPDPPALLPLGWPDMTTGAARCPPRRTATRKYNHAFSAVRRACSPKPNLPATRR